jgi:hypothetical protein
MGGRRREAIAVSMPMFLGMCHVPTRVGARLRVAVRRSWGRVCLSQPREAQAAITALPPRGREQSTAVLRLALERMPRTTLGDGEEAK